MITQSAILHRVAGREYLMRILLVYGLTALIVGCSPDIKTVEDSTGGKNLEGRHSEDFSQINPEPPAIPPETKSATDNTTPTYSILKDDISDSRRRVVDVELSSTTDEGALRMISSEIFSDGFEKTSIFFWLPGMTVGAGAWATAHYAPHLDIKILGEPALNSPEPIEQNVGVIIGTWRDASISRALYILFEKNGKYSMHMTFSDGSADQFGLEPHVTDTGERRFHDWQTGEDFKITTQGHLQIFRGDSLLATMIKSND